MVKPKMISAGSNKKPLWYAAASGLIFFCLMGIRLDLFRPQPVVTPLNAGKLAGTETWMNIFQGGQKIGYSHRRIDPREGGYTMNDTTFMRINTMGMVQDLHMRTRASLQPDLTLAGFDFTLRSNLFDFHATGDVRDQTLFVTVGDQRTEIPVDDGLFLTGGVLDAVADADLKVGESRTYRVFDPASLGRRPVSVRVEGEEFLDIMGRREKTMKLSVDFMGTAQTAWIGEDGGVVQEKGMMGILLKRVTQQEAFEGLTLSPRQDMTRMVSVPANVRLDRPAELSQIQMAITGIKNDLFLDGDRQLLTGRILTIRREPVPDPAVITTDPVQAFLAPTPFIESDHPDIVKRVAEIVSPEDTPLEKVTKIVGWIYDNIERRPVLSVPSALQTLKSRMGDCNEHAVLMAAMARAAGIPAQIEAGLVYMDGRFYYHAWNALYLDRWTTVDALMKQIPADVTHIRFVRGEPAQQIDLMGIIGAVRLKIIEPKGSTKSL